MQSIIIIEVDSDLAREARASATRRGTSLSRLVADQLETLVRSDQAYAAARRRALGRLRRGYHMGGEHLLSRNQARDR